MANRDHFFPFEYLFRLHFLRSFRDWIRLSPQATFPFSVIQILMSGGTGFSPIRSTVHVTMLPFSYTNNDVAKLFEPCGRIAQFVQSPLFTCSVTILRDKETRESKGVAWIQFVELH